MSAHNNALVVCDMQSDMMTSILPVSRRMAWLDAVQMSIHVARQANWPIVFVSLQFQSGYPEISPNHKIYGAFQRLNAKLGDDKVHWFMEGYPGAEILQSLVSAAKGDSNDERESDSDVTMITRQQHLPSSNLVELLQQKGITNVTVVGCKAGYSIQATVQTLCDAGWNVSVVKECIQDDDPARLEAVLQHLIPIYARIVDMVDFIDETVTMDAHVDRPKTKADLQDFDPSLVKYCCDCGRGGHAPMYISHLLCREEEWQLFPRQTWYIDFTKTFFCPLGKRVISFCDEPQFSSTSMYIKGREWLDEKEKLVDIAGTIMPETFLIKRRQWVGGEPKELLEEEEEKTNEEGDDDSSRNLVWFVKDANKNGGRAVLICNRLSECMSLTEPDEAYVVQRHIADPLLTDNGCKCHIKFYSLLECDENGVWQLFTYKDAFLSVSPNKWTPDDTSSETQITVKRNKRLRYGQTVDGWTNHESVWPTAYAKCKEATADIVSKAIEQDKLQVRPGKKQFEVFSADFMLDTFGKLWLIEFNFSPVLYDPSFANEENLTTAGLKRYHDLYLKQGDKAEVNDEDMIRDAVTIVFYDSKGLPSDSKWDAAGEFRTVVVA